MKAFVVISLITSLLLGNLLSAADSNLSSQAEASDQQGILAITNTDVNQDNLNTSLLKAARTDKLEEIQRLLEQGADIEAKDKRGQTSLHWVVLRGNLAVIEALLVKGSNIEAKDKHGQTPLHKAAIKGYALVIELLLANGANIAAKSKKGKTLLEFTSKGSKAERILKAEGAH